jgi:hypothetical protein
LRALLEYAEHEARCRGLQLTAQLIGAAALSVSDTEGWSHEDRIEHLPPIPRNRLH